MAINNEEELRKLYKQPSFRARNKSIVKLEKHSIHFIENSPFFTMGTSNNNGNHDVSPRGGNPGFVHVYDEETIIIPDGKGNNRLDSLINIIESPKVGLLFFIPGIDETLRINGTATISNEDMYLNLFKDEKHYPPVCIVLRIEEVFLHCAKAIMRSNLWGDTFKIDQDRFPTMGQMLKDQIGSNESPETRENMVDRYKKDI